MQIRKPPSSVDINLVRNGYYSLNSYSMLSKEILYAFFSNIQKDKFTFVGKSDINFKREFKKLEDIRKTPGFKPMASKRKAKSVYYVTPCLIREIEEFKRERHDFSKFKFELLTHLNFSEVVKKFSFWFRFS